MTKQTKDGSNKLQEIKAIGDQDKTASSSKTGFDFRVEDKHNNTALYQPSGKRYHPISKLVLAYKQHMTKLRQWFIILRPILDVLIIITLYALAIFPFPSGR